MKIDLKLIILVSFLLALLTSCGNSTEFKEEIVRSFESQVPVSKLTFANVNKSIIQPNCIQCHAGYGDYNTVFADKDKILSAVLEGRMPKNASALDDQLKGLLQKWIDSGAPNGSAGDDDQNVELVATWESLSTKVFFPKCVLCHNPNGQGSFLDLSTRQKFFEQRDDLLNGFEDVKNSYLLEVITDPEEPMPPVWSGIERLNENEIKVIIEWIEKGLP